MIKIIKPTCLLPISLFIFTLICTTPGFSDGTISKDVYSFKNENGNLVFTDKKPVNNKLFKTRTIETAKSSTSETSHSEFNSEARTINITQTQTVLAGDQPGKHKRSKNKKRNSTKRCQYYKEKLTYYSDKMREGYRSSEYKKLEKNRKKYRKLLFNRCDTKTFSD
jgi:hypothetical protein